MSTLSTNSVDRALSFMPDAEVAPRRTTGFLSRVQQFFEAMSGGLAAMHRYEALRASGVTPSEAAAKVHAEFYGN